MTYEDEVLLMAKEYVAMGWHVVCLHGVKDDGTCTCDNAKCTDIGKHPVSPRGVKDATRDLEVIEQQWFRPGVIRNVGIATGEISNLTVLDIDMGVGKFGADNWGKIVHEHGEVPTLMARTGSGGMHVLFTYNSALKTSSNTIDQHIDCRNDRGYIVAPPSRHRSGGRYVWINWGTALAPLPSWLTVKRDRRGRPKKDDAYRGKYSLEQCQTMLECVPADDRDLWRSVGIILGREFQRSDEAWNLYVSWSDKWQGAKSRGHDAIMHQAFYDISQQEGERTLTMGTIVKAALDNGWVPKRGEVPHEEFVYFGEGNNYIYRPTGHHWLARAVDAVCSKINVNGKLIKASLYIQEHAMCTSMTSLPQMDGDVIKGVNYRDGEIFKSPGAAIYNTYRPATIELGDARLAGPFIDHCRRLFNKPGDCDQFFDYLAHRVQRPWEKPRFGLMLAGGQGIGKDSAVELCTPAIGVWNVANIEPNAFETNYNTYATAVLVRINEAANLHDMSKWAFNERTKVLIAGSPDIVTINPKYGQQYSVKMYCGVIITTNHLAGGIYIPQDDRRYDVIECATLEEMQLTDELVRRAYFSDLWDWALEGGTSHVAAFLNERNLSNFSPNNGQRKTAAHREVIGYGAQQDEWLDDILDGMNYPEMIRLDWLVKAAIGKGEKEGDIRRKINPALSRLQYMKYSNPGARDGRWKIHGIKITVFIKIGTVVTPEHWTFIENHNV